MCTRGLKKRRLLERAVLIHPRHGATLNGVEGRIKTRVECGSRQGARGHSLDRPGPSERAGGRELADDRPCRRRPWLATVLTLVESSQAAWFHSQQVGKLFAQGGIRGPRAARLRACWAVDRRT